MNRATAFAAYQALGWKAFDRHDGERRARLLIWLSNRFERLYNA